MGDGGDVDDSTHRHAGTGQGPNGSGGLRCTDGTVATRGAELHDNFGEFLVLEGVSHAFAGSGGSELAALVLAGLDDFTTVAGGDGFGTGEVGGGHQNVVL